VSEKKKKKKLGNVAFIVICTLIGAVIGLVIGASGITIGFLDEMTWVDNIVFLVSLVIWIILATVVHEFGHLICGWISGYTFGSFKLGSLSWFIEDNGMIKFKRSKNFALGQCLMIPPDDEAEFKFLLYNLGGAIFNFLIGMTMLLFWYLLPTGHLLNGFAMAGVAFNFIFGIINLIPIRSQGNDGANIVEALKSADGRRAFYLLLYINGQRMQGKRLIEIDRDIIRIYGKLDTNSFLVGNALMYEVEYLMDIGRVEEALEICKSVNVENYPVIHRNLFSLYQVMIHLTYLPNLEKAKEIYEEKAFKAFLKLKLPSITAVQIAYEFFVNNNREEAEKLLAQAKKGAANIPNTGERLEMIDYLAHLEEKMVM